MTIIVLEMFDRPHNECELANHCSVCRTAVPLLLLVVLCNMAQNRRPLKRQRWLSVVLRSGNWYIRSDLRRFTAGGPRNFTKLNVCDTEEFATVVATDVAIKWNKLQRKDCFHWKSKCGNFSETIFHKGNLILTLSFLGKWQFLHDFSISPLLIPFDWKNSTRCVCEASIPGLHGLCIDKIRNNLLLWCCLTCYIIIWRIYQVMQTIDCKFSLLIQNKLPSYVFHMKLSDRRKQLFRSSWCRTHFLLWMDILCWRTAEFLLSALNLFYDQYL
jgi:hypothetical protein